MKKRFFASLLLLTLLLVGCTEDVPNTSSEQKAESSMAISSAGPSTEESDTDYSDLFTWAPHKLPFERSADYHELMARANGRAVVCTWGYDDADNEVWTYKFVEMADGPQAIKDGEDTVIPQNAPYMNNIYFEEFVIFPDGTAYGVYPPSVSARVAEVCDVDTDRDYGTIFSVDASGEELVCETTECFLPEGVFKLLERELGEIETEDNKYIFEVPEEYLSDDPTGLPFETTKDLEHITDGLRYACFERVIDDDGNMHWETVYRWPVQDPIWEIELTFVPTEKNLYGDGYDLYLIGVPNAQNSTVQIFATFSESMGEELPVGYEDCAGMDYGAIYTVDLTADELTYTVEYGFLGNGIASYIDVSD